MADIVAQLAPSADQRRSSVVGDGKGLDYPLSAAPVAVLIGDPYLARSADRVADRRRQVGLCRNRRAALRDKDWPARSTGCSHRSRSIGRSNYPLSGSNILLSERRMFLG